MPSPLRSSTCLMSTDEAPQTRTAEVAASTPMPGRRAGAVTATASGWAVTGALYEPLRKRSGGLRTESPPPGGRDVRAGTIPPVDGPIEALQAPRHRHHPQQRDPEQREVG